MIEQMNDDDVERVKEMIFAAYLDMDASDLAKRMNAGMSAQEALRLSLNGIIPEVISAYRHAALSEMDAENKRLEDALKRIEELEAEIKSLRWALKSLVQSCTTGIKIDDRDIGVKMPSAWQVDAARAALTQEKQT